jgi:soluble lytic murein transglycosylase-like protein
LALLLISLRIEAFASTCEPLLRAAEQRHGIPPGLLQAVALAESGRFDPDGKRLVAWPWTIAAGTEFSSYAPDKQAAIATVQRLLAAGRRNIDVGCMQVNLKHHPDAFPSLEAAFDPERNVAYGAAFLTSLRAETGSWERAVERYHSADPVLGPDYRAVVFDRWDRLRNGGVMLAALQRDEPAVLRPAAGGGRPGLFAWIAPAWRAVPLEPGRSLWNTGPAAPLVLRGRPAPHQGGQG